MLPERHLVAPQLRGLSLVNLVQAVFNNLRVQPRRRLRLLRLEMCPRYFTNHLAIPHTLPIGSLCR
jgi:hypothetical protein